MNYPKLIDSNAGLLDRRNRTEKARGRSMGEAMELKDSGEG